MSNWRANVDLLGLGTDVVRFAARSLLDPGAYRLQLRGDQAVVWGYVIPLANSPIYSGIQTGSPIDGPWPGYFAPFVEPDH